ncbi:MAG TPA: APA family fibronectin-binding glycoprotein [Gemmataceae bacterium]|nr:APA family fibronectin-binding glycoprotein [Gemmataceae bacterium]
MPHVSWATTIAFLLGSALPASAHFGISFRPRPTTAFYCPVPMPVAIVVMPAQICVPVPIDAPLVRPFARPQPAPPSGKEPPLVEPGTGAPPAKGPASPEPKTVEARKSSYFDSYVVAPGATMSANGHCSVSFWNLAPQGLVLKVGERRVQLASGRSLTLELDRKFTWQVEGRDPQTGEVATKDGALEIVIRR